MCLSSLSKHSDIGLLVLRFILGGMLMFYGRPILFGGVEKWQSVGQAMQGLGIHFGFQFWGFAAGLVMFVGGIFLILGFFFRPICILLTFVMIVAARMHFAKGDGLMVAAHAMEDGAIFFALIFIGPGRYSLDVWLKSILL